MKLVLLGAPGAGKGTQAENIPKWFAIPAVSTGNLIRQAVRDKTPSGLEAQKFMEAGDLVPDGIVVAMLKERIAQDDCRNGFILDGFPRNTAQAETLGAMGVEIDCALELEVSDSEIEARMTGRRVCESCGATYHVQYNPSPKGELCGVCGAKLIRRADDDPKVVRERLEVYHRETEPLKDYYQTRGKLKVVVGQIEVANTTRLVAEALGAQSALGAKPL